MDAARSGDEVTLSLSYDEAIVLSDVLHRWGADGTMDALPFEDQAEERVLWNLTAVLEPMIDEAFAPSYGERLERARAATRDETG
jgi:hypothetical protein